MKYSILSVGIVALSCILLAGCASTPKPESKPSPPRETVIFDYTPPSEITGSTKATIALIQTEYGSYSSKSMPMKEFLTATTEDIKEILIASGYDVKGPFNSFKSMSADGKQESNGVLIPRVEFDFDLTNTAVWRIGSYYGARGPAVVDCSISFLLVGNPISEVLSGEIIAVRPVTVDFETDKVFDYKPTIQDQIVEDNRTYNAFSRALKTQYDELMDKTYHHFNSSEFAGLIPSPKPPRTEIIFDYTVSKKAPVGSSDLTFAIVDTRFDTPISLFKVFAENMTKDFQEILTEKGYGIRGPFKTHDEMTYPDKAGSDLVIIADVDLRSDPKLKWDKVKLYGSTEEEEYYRDEVERAKAKFFGSTEEEKEYYRASGSITISGDINLVLYEALTQERMWIKHLALIPLVVNVSNVGEKLPSDASLEGLLREDNQFHADLGKALQSQYNEVMGKIEAYLDPREMKILAKQVQRLRKQKVFQ